MHNGVFGMLEDVVSFSRQISGGGGRGQAAEAAVEHATIQVGRAQIDPLVRQLHLRRGGQQDTSSSERIGPGRRI